MRCTSSELCHKCGDNHHTLLHLPIHQRLEHRTSKSRPSVKRQQHRQQKVKRQHKTPVLRQRKSGTSSTSATMQCLRIALKALEQLEKTL